MFKNQGSTIQVNKKVNANHDPPIQKRKHVTSDVGIGGMPKDMSQGRIFPVEGNEKTDNHANANRRCNNTSFKEEKKDFVMTPDPTNPLKFVIRRWPIEIKQELDLHHSGYQDESGCEGSSTKTDHDMSLSKKQPTLASGSNTGSAVFTNDSFANASQTSGHNTIDQMWRREVPSQFQNSFNPNSGRPMITTSLANPTTFNQTKINSKFGHSVINQQTINTAIRYPISIIKPAAKKVVINAIVTKSSPWQILNNPSMNEVSRGQGLINQSPKKFLIKPAILNPIVSHNLLNTSSKYVDFSETQLNSTKGAFPQPSIGHQSMNQTEVKTETKEELILTEVKQEPCDDFWSSAIPPSQSEIELDAILRRELIKRELLPFDVQEKLEMLKNNEKPSPPPCGCIQAGDSKLIVTYHNSGRTTYLINVLESYIIMLALY